MQNKTRRRIAKILGHGVGAQERLVRQRHGVLNLGSVLECAVNHVPDEAYDELADRRGSGLGNGERLFLHVRGTCKDFPPAAGLDRLRAYASSSRHEEAALREP